MLDHFPNLNVALRRSYKLRSKKIQKQALRITTTAQTAVRRLVDSHVPQRLTCSIFTLLSFLNLPFDGVCGITIELQEAWNNLRDVLVISLIYIFHKEDVSIFQNQQPFLQALLLEL